MVKQRAMLMDKMAENPDQHYWTEVTRKNFLNETVTDRYAYFIAKLPDGQAYTQRIETTINGFQTITTYNYLGRPLKIARGADTTTFVYNESNLLTRKETKPRNYKDYLS